MPARHLHSRKYAQRRRLQGRSLSSWKGQKVGVDHAPITMTDRFRPSHRALMFGGAEDVVIPGFAGVELCAEDFPTKLPSSQPRRPLTPHVTVHQYTYGSQRILRSNPLDAGRRVVEMATATSGWRTANPPVFECMPPDALAVHSPTLTILQLSNLQGRPLFCLRTTGPHSLIRRFAGARKGVGRTTLT